MKIIPFQAYAERGWSSLLQFLSDCRERARERGQFQITSISLGIKRIDPLAVLESIFEPKEVHFYLEKPSEGWAVAGADGVVSCRLDGKDRFLQAKRFTQEILEQTVAIGDVDGAFGGPHFFCAFSFFDSTKEGDAFPGATLFLPRWQVARQGESCCAVANLKIEPDAEIEEIAAKVWRAHQKFSSFDYLNQAGEPHVRDRRGPSVSLSLFREADSSMDFQSAVNRALEAIRLGKYNKVVLARALDLTLSENVNPLHALNELRTCYPSCYAYSFANGEGQSFIGASPELLLKVKGGELFTEALAGSAPRGRSAADDAFLAQELLGSQKDIHEHKLVVDSIVRRLRGLGLDLISPGEPRLLQLPNVQHLHTPLRAPTTSGAHLFDLLAGLHPTPAVGGVPRDVACAAISELESFDRGLYAGPVGWMDYKGEGEFTVAIRSSLIDGHHARLYAGAGIVEGSRPEKEWAETELKFKALMEALL